MLSGMAKERSEGPISDSEVISKTEFLIGAERWAVVLTSPRLRQARQSAEIRWSWLDLVNAAVSKTVVGICGFGIMCAKEVGESNF